MLHVIRNSVTGAENAFEFAPPPLPADYRYTDALDPWEATGLIRGHYPEPDCTVSQWVDEIDHQESFGSTIAEVGVFHASASREQLVGMARLVFRKDHGELDSLVVHTDHRGQRLGRSLIEYRLRLAEMLGVQSLYMPFIEAGQESYNPYMNFYLDAGFSRNAQGEFRFGPQAGPLFAAQ